MIKEHSRTGEDRRQGEDRLKTRRGRWRWTGASRDKKRTVRQDRQQRGGCKKQCRGQGVLECDKQYKGKGMLECDNRWQSNFTEDCVGDVERYISVV